MPRFVFGPVFSRRLGRSLGVNNIPYKTCSYSCIYCQLGRTENFTAERKSFYNWREIVGEVLAALNELKGGVDYVTFVPDGEPLLDKDIGREIEGIKEGSGIPVAVITNSSLLHSEDARIDLMKADTASIKVDSVRESVWRRINRPYRSLSLSKILEGIEDFSKDFKGRLITETMLVDEVNTERGILEETATFIKELDPAVAYISIPIRPPAEPFVRPPPPEKLVEAHELFRERLGEGKAELLNLPEPPAPLS